MQNARKNRAFCITVVYCREFSGSVTRGWHYVSFQLTFHQLKAEVMLNHGLQARGSDYKTPPLGGWGAYLQALY